jgi:hypothetical protein
MGVYLTEKMFDVSVWALNNGSEDNYPLVTIFCPASFPTWPILSCSTKRRQKGKERPGKNDARVEIKKKNQFSSLIKNR